MRLCIDSREDICTWRIMKHDQLKHPTVIISEPLMESWRFVPPLPCGYFVLPSVHGNLMNGPFTKVMIMAPETVANVPITLAWLRMLRSFTFSSLYRFGNFFNEFLGIFTH